jgi:hypothetical protein
VRRKTADIRKRLKIHVKSKGENSDFEITPSFCLYWWRHLNEAVFDGALTPPARFEFKNYRDMAGFCKPWYANRKQRRVIIGISSEIWSRKKFLEVLAHEMVHQWEWEILADWNTKTMHGKNFFAWKNKMKYRAGLPLTISVDI